MAFAARAFARRAACLLEGAAAGKLVAWPGTMGASTSSARPAIFITMAHHSTGAGSAASIDPTLSSYRDREFELTRTAHLQNQEKVRLDAVRVQQEVRDILLKKREAFLREHEGKKKVPLVFLLKGVKMQVGELYIQDSDLEMLQSAYMTDIPGVRPCIGEDLCRLGLDKEMLMRVLAEVLQKKKHEDSSETSEAEAGGKSQEEAKKKGQTKKTAGGKSQEEAEQPPKEENYNLDRIWALLGRKPDAEKSTTAWLFGMVAGSVDWWQVAAFILLAAEAGVAINGDLLVNLLIVYKEHKLRDSKDMFDEALRRTAAAQ